MWYFIAIILNALTLAASKHITVTNGMYGWINGLLFCMVQMSYKCLLLYKRKLNTILDSTRGKMMVCTTSTAADLKESKFKIENSDLNLCTHLICIDNIWDKTIGKWNEI